MTEVRVERFSDKITLHSEWFPGVADMCKRVPGARWNKEARCWYYPLTLQTCRELRRVFTDMLVIGPELSAWAREEIALESRLIEASSAKDTGDLLTVQRLAPKMASAMDNRPYQKVGAHYVSAAAPTGGVGIWDEPSLGKTITTFAGLMEAGLWEGMHLVAAPKSSLETVWHDQLYKWAGETDARAFYMPDGKTKREAAIKEFMDSDAVTKFLIVNPEMLQVRKEQWCPKCEMWEPRNKQPWPDMNHWTDGHKTQPRISKCDWPGLFDLRWRSVTFDEVQKYLIGIRGPRKKTQVGEGAMSLGADLRIALSGTPFKGMTKNLWGILHWLRPDEYRSFWQWAETYLEITDNGFGKEVGTLRPSKEEDFYKSLDRIAIRRTKREVRPDLPENDWQEYWVSMLPAQQKQYDALVKEGEALIGGVQVMTKGVLDELTRLKQIAYGVMTTTDGRALYPTDKSPKLDLLLQMLEERGVTGKPETEFGEMKFVIASQFTRIVDSVQAELEKRGIATLKITGDVTGRKRTDAQNQFNAEGGPRVLVINTTAGGVAIDLDERCDEMFILDETWVPDEQKQLEGRIDNRGERIAARTFHYIRTKGTVEEGIASLNISKDEIQQAILDKRRGIEMTRILLGIGAGK